MSQPSMMEMMKQARDLQKKMKKIQKKVEAAEITATAGGGSVMKRPAAASTDELAYAGTLPREKR